MLLTVRSGSLNPPEISLRRLDGGRIYVESRAGVERDRRYIAAGRQRAPASFIGGGNDRRDGRRPLVPRRHVSRSLAVRLSFTSRRPAISARVDDRREVACAL